MAIESEVLVVGGGLAGRIAALSAARSGAQVRLVTYKQSTLQQASGLVDVLGYRPDGDGEYEGPLVDPFEALDDLPAGHPYKRVGEDAVRAGLSLFEDVVPGYRGDHTDANALLPTVGGTVKPTARYPASAAAGLASDDRDVLLVGFDLATDFDAPLAARHLEATGVPFDVRGATVQFPGDLRADAKATRFAHLLDRDAPTADGPTRAVLAEAVAEHHDGEPRVGFPAVLGDDQPTAIREDLSDRLHADVFEVPTGPPSLPGLRLADRLDAALEAEGVYVTAGNPVVGYEGDGDRIEHLLVEHGGGGSVPYGAEQYVLATGGLVGKGVDSDREGVREPIFDCHVPHPGDRYDWFDETAFGDHPFARFGVPIDGDCRPLGSDDAPEFENLRAAGSVVGGYDFAAEKSGSGVSLSTGYAAGTAAATEV